MSWWWPGQRKNDGDAAAHERAVAAKLEVDAYRPLKLRRRLLIAALAVVTAVGVTLSLTERKGRVQPDPRLLPADSGRCAPGQTTGCVGGKAEVIVMPPAPGSAASGSVPR